MEGGEERGQEILGKREMLGKTEMEKVHESAQESLRGIFSERLQEGRGFGGENRALVGVPLALDASQPAGRGLNKRPAIVIVVLSVIHLSGMNLVL